MKADEAGANSSDWFGCCSHRDYRGNAYIIPAGCFLFGFISWFGATTCGSSNGENRVFTNKSFYGDRVTGTLHLKATAFPLPWVTCIVEWPEELVMKQKELPSGMRVNSSLNLFTPCAVLSE